MPDERKSELERHQDRAAFRDAIPAVVALIVLEGIVAALDSRRRFERVAPGDRVVAAAGGGVAGVGAAADAAAL